MLLYIDDFNTCCYYNGVIILYLKLIFLIIHIRDMGVNDLNQITIGCKTYKGRFNTIIIDGSNLLFTSLTSVVSRMRKENSKVIGDVKVIDSPNLPYMSQPYNWLFLIEPSLSHMLVAKSYVVKLGYWSTYNIVYLQLC